MLDSRLAACSSEYCARVFRVQNKGGEQVPLVYNRSQLWLESFAERMLAEEGRVRMLVVKGRQIGCTQWVASRFLRKVSQSWGKHVYVLAHDKATAAMVRSRVLYMIERAPAEYRPKITAKDTERLTFGLQEAGYIVSTAGSDVGTGRGETIQFFHGLECSRWPHAEEHRSGAMETVALRAGTEIVMETTSSGFGGMFYEMCMEALAGEGIYRIAFCPWWWDDEYREEGDAELSRDEEQYVLTHGLDDGQAVWFHRKNRALGSRDGKLCLKMKQEYPSTVAEAFEADDSEAFISTLDVSAARKSTLSLEAQHESERESVLGVDVGRTRDPSFLCDRLGRVLGGRVYEKMESGRVMDVANRVAALIQEYEFDWVFVDLGRDGSGVVDRLREMGFGRDRGVFGIDFGAGAEDPSRYLNKRCEMYGSMKDWLIEEGGARIPDDDMLQGELCAPREVPDVHARVKLEPKEDIKRRLSRSPDRADAAVLTFAGGKRVRGKRRPETPARRRRRIRLPSSWMAR